MAVTNKRIYVAYEMDDGIILEVLGVFDDFSNAIHHCAELFEERGFESHEKDIFDSDYNVEAFEIE